MRQLLEEIDWHTNLYPLNTLEAWDFFASHFESCLGECVPYKTSSSKKTKYVYVSASFTS